MIRFALSPPRHPLARIAFAAAAIVVLALLSVIGVAFAAAIFLAWGGRALWLSLRGPLQQEQRTTTHDPQVIEGEFTVVDSQRLPRR